MLTFSILGTVFTHFTLVRLNFLLLRLGEGDQSRAEQDDNWLHCPTEVTSKVPRPVGVCVAIKELRQLNKERLMFVILEIEGNWGHQICGKNKSECNPLGLYRAAAPQSHCK